MMLSKSLVVCAILGGFTVVIASAAQPTRALLEQTQPPSAPSLSSRSVSIELHGWSHPPVVAADQANIADEAMVIGLQCGDRARAYLLPFRQAGTESEGFIIRDRLGGQDVTLALSGRDDQIVVWRQDDDGRRQRHPFQLASWYTWRRAHPGTDLAGTAELPQAEQRG
jgi:hypothetical protein